MTRTYFTIINVLLLTAAVYLGVSCFYKAAATRLQQNRQPGITTRSIAQAREKQAQPLSAYNVIVERNLFHTEQDSAETAARQIDLEGLKQTELKLKLWGTVTGQDKKSRAVIEDTQQRSQNLYRTGDTIQGATLKMILREKVVLSVNGQDEILEMEKLKSGPASRVGGARDYGAAPAAGTVRTQKIKLKRALIEEAMADVNDLMQQVKVRPYMEKGNAAGLILSGIKPNSIFRKMGLRNGDIIKGVEGEEITSMDDALGFYTKLKSASAATLQIKRRGRLRDLEYSIE